MSSKSSKSSRTSKSSRSTKSSVSSRGANASALKKSQEHPVWFKNVRKQHKTGKSKKHVVPDADASEEDDMKYLKSALKPKKMTTRDKKKMSGITGHEKTDKANGRMSLGGSHTVSRSTQTSTDRGTQTGDARSTQTQTQGMRWGPVPSN